MTEDFHESVRRHYEAYGRDFSDLDPDAAVSHWNAPSIRASPEGVTLDERIEDRRDGFADVIDRLESTDYDHSEPTAIRARPLSNSLALSNVVWERRTAEGDLVDRFSPLHLLVRTDDGWTFTVRSSRRSAGPLEMRPVDHGSAGAEAADLDAAFEGPDAIVAFFEEYARAFSTLDAEAIAAHWNVPAAIVRPAGVRPFAEAEDVAATFGAIGDDLRDRGYERSEPLAVYAHELDDSVAVADVLWDRYDERGDLLDRIAVLHLLRETDDGWKLVAITPHPPETMVSLSEGSSSARGQK